MEVERKQLPEERARYCCESCGDLLFSGQVVYTEVLYGDVLGCCQCAEWRDAQAYGEHTCPNCGADLWDEGRALVGTGGEVLACMGCASEGYAADRCRTVEEMRLNGVV